MSGAIRELLDETVRRAARFLESLPERPVAAARGADELAPALGGALPKAGLPVSAILSRLDEGPGGRARLRARPRAISASSPAASCRRRWLRTGWRPRGTGMPSAK